jgi:PAS domain S-box-containing protein
MNRRSKPPAIDWRDVIAISADWYWEQDAELRFTYFTSPEMAAAGMSDATYAGRTRWDSPHHSVSAAQWAEHRAALERREPFRDFVVGRYRDDGSECFVAISGRPHFDDAGRFLGYRGISRDVTALVRAEQALRESEARYRALVETSPDAVLLLSAGRIAFINPSGARMYGASGPGQLVGMEMLERVHPDERERVAGRVRTLMQEQQPVPPAVIRQLRLDGSFFHGEVVSTPFQVAGRPGSLTVVRDVTERHEAEARILALNAELEARVRERTRQLEDANRELESFSYSVSHDLRAPLRAIHGFAGLLAQRAGEGLDEQGRHYLGRIQEASARMGRLIDELLELSRLSRAALRPEALDLSRMAAQVVEDLRAGEPRRPVAVEIAPGLAARGDPAQVRVLLQNLVENAWKFTRPAAAPRIEVGREGEAFFVRDNGAGFDMRYVEKLFGAFQRLHAEEEFGGTGIGLATVQRIVARHGGRIWAEGEPGRGATFRFTLPDPA